MRLRHRSIGIVQHESHTPASDLALVRRAARFMAIRASLALALVLFVVGIVVYIVDARAQNRQMTAELQRVASIADDADDAPPDMELAIRTRSGKVSHSDGGLPGVALLSGPTGFSNLDTEGRRYRTLVVDRPSARIVAMMDLAPYHAARDRLLLSLAVAELAGIAASVAAVVLFTRRSVQPLVQALALQRRFVADASHELRAPLTVLFTRVQLLAHRVDPALRGEVDAVVADTRALGEIVGDLLASATMTARRPASERVDMSAIAESVCASMAPFAESQGVTLRNQLENGDTAAEFEVTGSETALRRALTSLIDNALGHEHPGGTVDVTTSRNDSAVSFVVKDNGVGIDPETMSTLFTRFSPGTKHTANGRESHGIGLALVREIAQAHGGDVTVASEPGDGAVFTFAVPRSA
ncbi:HAMP domain-containing histidine kinase [Mycolicibacterium sphagni]|nr:HAMP domain-containing histidine kinase [Mycolicibacterium sphagni]